MKHHHYLYMALGYIGLGVVWVAASEHVLPATVAPPPLTPPGGITGQILLWPAAAGGYIYAKATGA